MAKEYVGNTEIEEKELKELAADMKQILKEKIGEAWRTPEGREIKRRLSNVAETHWKPQIKEALQVTKYAEELKSRAREIKYDEKVKKVWK